MSARIIYDFQGTKPTARAQAQTQEGKLIQYSVYMTKDQRAAKAIKDLVQHYQREATLFKGQLADLK